MSTSLPADIAARIQAQVASGRFANEEDVLREALSVLEKRQAGLEQLRDIVREAEEDVAAGRVGPFDAENTIGAVRKRLASQNGID